MRCFMSDKACEYEMKKDVSSNVFFISPFGYPFEDIYKYGIRNVLRKIDYGEINVNQSSIPCKLKADRANQELQLGFVMCQRICRKIQESQFIIADISAPNPNVFYELGLSYGMNKKIILIGQQPYENALTFGLLNTRNAYIQYRTIDDLKGKKLFVDALKSAVEGPTNTNDSTGSKILNIINGNISAPEIHEKTLKRSIDELNKKQKLKNRWEIITKTISSSSKIDNIIAHFQQCKICVVDTTSYGHYETECNPYLYFCLGLGHGFQKEVIPISNTPESGSNIPFDVRGLWHIFFSNLKQLKTQFIDIMPKIDEDWHIEQRSVLQKKFWSPFLQNKDLHIMSCARDVVATGRGSRTTIDKWDYCVVSELAHFTAVKYPKAKVTIEPPRNKLTNDEIKKSGKNSIKDQIKRHLLDKDCILIGSTHVSDLAEIVLAELHKIEPYETYPKKFEGHVIVKKLEPIKTSSFYLLPSSDEIEGISMQKEKASSDPDYKNVIQNNGGITYGILTIADNPFVSPGKKRKIMILSGFSGVATYAMAKLITDDKYEKQLKNLLQKWPARDEKFVEIIVKTEFSFNESIIQGDNRKLAGLEVL